jgi:ACS family tartrate transporter-like MFS transporter
MPILDRCFPFLRPNTAETVAERTRRRVTLHLIPFLFFLYILAYLDRVNVGVAQLGMKKPVAEGGLGFDSETIGIGAGLFFWGYLILEVPSSISVVKKGARRVLVRVLILWGICATLAGFIGTPVVGRLFDWLPHLSVADESLLAGPVAFINGLRDNPRTQFFFLRFMLGVFEGGFFPSVIVYLSHWFRPGDRARAVAGFTLAIPLSSMLGMPASALLLGVNWLGLPGWRWIFILQGVAPILAGVATFFMLPDRPNVARWLRNDERDWLNAELAAEAAGKKGHGHGEWVGHLGMVLLLTCVYFGQNVASYGLTMFMPAIIKSQSGLSDQLSSMLGAVPYAFALLGMLLNGWHSDKTDERFGHAAAAMGLLGLGVLAAGLLNDVPILPIAIMILWVGTVIYAHLPPFWPIPTSVLGATTAASAIGFINMFGNLGGYLGPRLVGGQDTNVGRALLLIAPWPMASAVIVLGLGWWRRRKASNQLGGDARSGA